MFNLALNWLKILKENIPLSLHSTSMFDWLKVLISPFNKIHSELMQAYDIFILKIRYTGQVCYMEAILNAKFSPLGGGIYIIDGGIASKRFIYNTIELKPPYYTYRVWQSTIAYAVNEFSTDGNKVYKCLVANTNKQPSTNPTEWEFYKDIEFIRQSSEFYLTYNFIVKVPSALVYNEISMRAIIDYYRLAGKKYKIETY